MDFDDTPEEAAFRAEARAWLVAHAPAKGSPGDFSDGYLSGRMTAADYVESCKRWQRALHDGGWSGLAWPTEFGGRGRTWGEQAIFHQEMGDFGVSVGIFAVAHGMVGPTLMHHGTLAQRERFLPSMLRGEELWCQLFSEPGAGSDLARLRTRADRDGDCYVVSGQKVWTSSAAESDWGILLARTDFDAPKHKGITCFLVDMLSPGIEVRPLQQMNGMAHFNEVFLDGVRVPAANVVGEPNDGWRVAITTLSNERVAIGDSSPSDEFADLAQLVRQRGRSADPLIRQQLAGVYASQSILRFLRYRMHTALSRGTVPGPEASVMKLFHTSHTKRLAEVAAGVSGPRAMLWRDPAADDFWQSRFLMAPGQSIGGGTDEVQRNAIAERFLGLPREPHTDRDIAFRELLSAGR